MVALEHVGQIRCNARGLVIPGSLSRAKESSTERLVMSGYNRSKNIEERRRFCSPMTRPSIDQKTFAQRMDARVPLTPNGFGGLFDARPEKL